MSEIGPPPLPAPRFDRCEPAAERIKRNDDGAPHEVHTGQSEPLSGRFVCRVRVTGQLIDAANGVHLWADRYDRELADIFELQDEIT